MFSIATDKKVLEKYESSKSVILSISDSNPRRQIQITYLNSIGVEKIKDTPQVIDTVDDINLDEFLLQSEIKDVIENEYYVNNVKVDYAIISHGLGVFVEPLEEGGVHVFLSKDSSDIRNILSVQNDQPNLFRPLVRDFVRTVLYQQFSAYIPKSMCDRIHYITKIFNRKREEWEVSYGDYGYEEEIFQKFKSKEITPSEAIQLIKLRTETHQQTITQHQVGDVLEVVKTASIGEAIKHNISVEQAIDVNVDNPRPPILCLENSSKLKILKTDDAFPILNNNKMFMALTDKTVSANRLFFTVPHTTKVLWGMHRLIYMFTDVMGKESLYYDLELKHKIPNKTGGKSVATTTIITKNTIYVPIVPELYEYFTLKNDIKLKFLVRFERIDND